MMYGYRLGYRCTIRVQSRCHTDSHNRFPISPEITLAQLIPISDEEENTMKSHDGNKEAVQTKLPKNREQERNIANSHHLQ
jgi:hypothetical protein